MSISYVIVSERPLELDDSAFIHALMERWPETLIEPVPAPKPYAHRRYARCVPVGRRRALAQSVVDYVSPYSFTWEIRSEGMNLWGRFFKDGEAVAFEGQWADCVIFALWFRSYVPEQQPLTFCDNMFNHDIALEIETGADDIDRAFSG